MTKAKCLYPKDAMSWKGKKMNQDEKRMADSYEIEFALMVNGKEIVFGTDEKTALRYMVGFCSLDPIFGIEHYHNCIATGSYAEALKEIGERVRTEAEKSFSIQQERGIFETLSYDDCIPGSEHEHYAGRLIVVRSEILQKDKQTADYQLCRAESGFGCSGSARGRAVYVRTVYDNREMRYDREDILGVIKPERIPGWAKARLLEEQKKKQDQFER